MAAIWADRMRIATAGPSTVGSGRSQCTSIQNSGSARTGTVRRNCSDTRTAPAQRGSFVGDIPQLEKFGLENELEEYLERPDVCLDDPFEELSNELRYARGVDLPKGWGRD
jgi:hypothetical protein